MMKVAVTALLLSSLSGVLPSEELPSCESVKQEKDIPCKLKSHADLAYYPERTRTSFIRGRVVTRADIKVTNSSTPYHRVEVEGPIRLKVDTRPDGPSDCKRLVIGGNLGVVHQLSVQQEGDLLKFSVPTNLEQTDFLSLDLTCPSVVDVKARDFSAAVVRSNNLARLDVSAHNAYVAVSGRAELLRATASSEGSIQLKTVKATHFDMTTGGTGHIELLKPSSFAANASNGGGIHIYQEEGHKADVKREIQPGVYSRAINYTSKEDNNTVVKYKHFWHVKKRMEDTQQLN